MKEKETLNEWKDVTDQVDMAFRYTKMLKPQGFDVVWTMEGDYIRLVIKREPLTLADFIRGTVVTSKGEK